MRRLLVGTLFLSALFASSANATTVEELSLVDLDDRASVVVLGEVVQVDSYWSDGLILTDTTIEVIDCYTGVCGDTVVVTNVGGQVGDIEQRLQGAAVYEPGERVFAFLTHSAQDRLQTVGMAQGLYHVEVVGDDVLAWADHSGMRLVDRHGNAHPSAPRVTFHLADLIYAVRHDLPVAPMSPEELPALAVN